MVFCIIRTHECDSLQRLAGRTPSSPPPWQRGRRPQRRPAPGLASLLAFLQHKGPPSSACAANDFFFSGVLSSRTPRWMARRDTTLPLLGSAAGNRFSLCRWARFRTGPDGRGHDTQGPVVPARQDHCVGFGGGVAQARAADRARLDFC